MTVSGQFSCPPAGNFVAVSGQFLVAAYIGGTHVIRRESRRDGRYFREPLAYWQAKSPGEWRREVSETAADRMVAPDQVTTLPSLPGVTVTRSLGVVTAVTSNAGWTARHKGTTALELATAELRTAAFARGANAVVGLHVAVSGPAGGITSVVGGDAVGVLLLGTAVATTPAPLPSEPHSLP